MTQLSATLLALGLPADLEAKLNDFAALFRKWNRNINLSAARTEDDLRHHIIDCLHVVPHLRDLARVLDVGAGGGLPSVVAAISLPRVHLTALEPVHKKHAFLRTAARELDVPNLDPRAERLDDHAHHDYDAAMSRATFDLRDWLELAVSHVRPGGVVLGFEATLRSDLPQAVQRTPYLLDQKTRAIVALRLER